MTIRMRRSPPRRSCITAGCTCRCPRAKSRRWAIRAIPAARSAAASSRSMRPPAGGSGRPTPSPRVPRRRQRTASGRSCTDRRAAPSGTRRRSTPSAACCTSEPATTSRRRRRRSRIRWSRSTSETGQCAGRNRSPRTTSGTAAAARRIAKPAVCPDKDAPDFDFTGSSFLVDAGNGRQLIVVGNKSGVIFAFDPDAAGKIVWERRVAQGSSSGGVFWGSATDGVNIYAANADFFADKPEESGGMNAVDLRTGRLVWGVPGAGCANKKPCKPSQNAAVTLIPGVVFSGTMDGRLRAYSTRDGQRPLGIRHRAGVPHRQRREGERRLDEQSRSSDRRRHAVREFGLFAPRRNPAGQRAARVFDGVAS